MIKVRMCQQYMPDLPLFIFIKHRPDGACVYKYFIINKKAGQVCIRKLNGGASENQYVHFFMSPFFLNKKVILHVFISYFPETLPDRKQSSFQGVYFPSPKPCHFEMTKSYTSISQYDMTGFLMYFPAMHNSEKPLNKSLSYEQIRYQFPLKKYHLHPGLE